MSGILFRKERYTSIANILKNSDCPRIHYKHKTCMWDLSNDCKNYGYFVAVKKAFCDNIYRQRDIG